MEQNIIDSPEVTPVKTSSTAEKIAIGLTLLGSVFKVMHWPGAGIILTVSLSALSLIYFPLGFYFLNSEMKETKHRALSTLAGWSFSVFTMGVLFKIMHWPGASVFMIVSAVAVPAVFALLYFIRNKASEGEMNFYNNLLLRAGLISVILIFVLLAKMN